MAFPIRLPLYWYSAVITMLLLMISGGAVQTAVASTGHKHAAHKHPAAKGKTAAHKAPKEKGNAALGRIAEEQIRHIATFMPGRMAGTHAEKLTADYLQLRFDQLRYQTHLQSFPAGYYYEYDNHTSRFFPVNAVSLIADKPGTVPQTIMVVAHLDTHIPQSDSDVKQRLGGPLLQGVDDNTSGLGVMLELAEHLSRITPYYSLRFLAVSAEEIGAQGSTYYLQHLSAEERNNIVLVINLDSLIVGDQLYFNSGVNTPPDIARKTRDRALIIAHNSKIEASTNPGNGRYPYGTGCCSDQQPFDTNKLPVLSLEATNWSLGRQDGYQQRVFSRAFPDGTSWHQIDRDNLNYLDQNLPGQIKQRSHDSVAILLPLIKELALSNSLSPAGEKKKVAGARKKKAAHAKKKTRH